MDSIARRLREASTNDTPGWPSELLLEASKTIDYLQGRVGLVEPEAELFIHGTYLVEVTSECTCGATSDETHHRYCGAKVIANLNELPGYSELNSDHDPDHIHFLH